MNVGLEPALGYETARVASARRAPDDVAEPLAGFRARRPARFTGT